MSFCEKFCSTFSAFYHTDRFHSTFSVRESAMRFSLRPGEESLGKVIKELVDRSVHEFLINHGKRTHYREGLVSDRGFKILGETVLDHEQLQGWLLKGGGHSKHGGPMMPSGVKNSQGYDVYKRLNLLRVPMAARMQQVVIEDQLSEILIPEKRLVRSHICDVYRPEPNDWGKLELAELHEKYYVLSKKVEVLDSRQTRESFEQMAPDRLRKIARQICKLIVETGFADAHLGNIQLTKDLSKVVVIDTEPHGAMREKTDRSPNCTLSIKHCALIGLQEFSNQEISPIFQEEGQKAIRAVKSKIFWQKFKIAASVFIPLIPIALLLIGVVKGIRTVCTKSIRQQNKSVAHIA